MRAKFLLFPVALITSPAVAEDFRFPTVSEAQQLLFPGATFTPADITLSDTDAERLGNISGTIVFRNKVTLWRVSTGGWFFLDQVPGRDDRITYAVGLTQEGNIKGIEILMCLPEYSGIRQAEWRSQFVGRRFRPGHMIAEIANISGTTLSSAHITDGVTRVLAAYALFIAPKNG